VSSRKTWLVVGAVALAAGGFWYVSQRKKKEEKKAQAPKGYMGNDRFPTAESFGFGLLALGYPTAVGTPGWKLDDVQTKGQVSAFQKDFNLVRSQIKDVFGTEIGPQDLRTDGVVDQRTVNALTAATDFIEINEEDLGAWPTIVEEARLPPVPPPPAS